MFTGSAMKPTYFGENFSNLLLHLNRLCVSVYFLTCVLMTVGSHGYMGQRIDTIPSVFPSRLSPPGLHSHDKVWWAKEIIPDFHVCGRLSYKQILYAADAGFKSILSLFPYPDDCAGDFGGDYLPVTSEAKDMVENVAGLQFESLLEPLDEWSSVEAVEKFTAVAPRLKRPALLHCDRGYTIAFVVLLYLANQTRHDADFGPKVYSKQVYEISASMGLDFLSRIPVETVSEVTGEPMVSLDDPQVPSANFVPVDWLDFWLAHPVYINWFIAGQIYNSHIPLLQEFGYKTIVNLRTSNIYKQEAVNIVNFHREQQQMTANFDVRASSYTDDEGLNSQEFGDVLGYNETLEKMAVEKSELGYINIPLHESMDYFHEFINKHEDQLLDIGSRGGILVHCSNMMRAAYVTVLISAIQYDLSLAWALQRLKELGFGVSAESHPNIFKVYQHHLREKRKLEL